MLRFFLPIGLLSASLYCAPPVDECSIEKMPLAPRYENNIFLTADFIYWLAKQEGNDYAYTGTAITVPGTTDPNTGLVPPWIDNIGSVYAPNPQAKPGFKVGLGVDLSYDEWDFYAEYTYLSNKAHSSVYSNFLNTGILPIFSYTPNNSILAQCTYAVSTGATGFLTQAMGHWSLRFNNVTVELGKWIPLFSSLSIHPHFGLQGSWQSQHFNVSYTVGSTTNALNTIGENQVNFRQQFGGVGPRAGLDTSWQCIDHYGLFANTSFAALWSKFKSVSSSVDSNFSSGYTNVLIAKQANRPKTLSPVGSIEIGIQTDWCLRENVLFFGQLGWEAQVWLFQNQHSTSIADTSLILQGLTLSFRCDF